MFVYLIACFEHSETESPSETEPASEIAQLQQDISSLTSTLEAQHNKIQALEEDYSLLLTDYTALLNATSSLEAEQQTLSAALLSAQNDHNNFVSTQEILNATHTSEQEALWASLQTTQDNLPSLVPFTIPTPNDYTQQVTKFYFNLPTRTILGVLPILGQGTQCTIQVGTNNWGSSFGLWQNDTGGYHKSIDEFVVEPSLTPAPSPEKWPWVILDCTRVGGSAEYSVEIWVAYL